MEWRRLAAHTGLLMLASAVLTLPASAAAGGAALPWEAPLTRLQQSLSGPVAGAIAVIALVAIGVTLMFGGEWNEFARRAKLGGNPLAEFYGFDEFGNQQHRSWHNAAAFAKEHREHTTWSDLGKPIPVVASLYRDSPSGDCKSPRKHVPRWSHWWRICCGPGLLGDRPP